MPTETQLRDIFNALGDGVFVASAEGRYIDVNPAGCAMFGYGRDELLALSLPDLLVEAEHSRLDAAIASMADGKIQRSEWRFRRKDGSVFTGELVGGQLPDGRFQSVVRDVTERVERDLHEELVRREASHRTKNILTLVQAIARRSAVHAAAEQDDFLNRLAALAASHDLFTANDWARVDLAELIATQLGPFTRSGDQRVSIGGAPTALAPAAARAIGMALHELATNAIKYGALASDQGRVSIDWQVRDDGAFELTWRESGGPAVEPPTHSGFGTRMIRGITERSLRATTSMRYARSGIVWQLACPIGALTDD